MQATAHYSAAIEVMGEVLAGEPAERALLAWSRASRFAGSKDRAAVRDIVFECLRKQRSYAARFGESARGIVLGRAFDVGEVELFDGQGYGPEAVSEAERARFSDFEFASLAEALDVPDFVFALLQAQYGAQTTELLEALRSRAPVDLRVNIAKTSRQGAQDLLAKEYIFTDTVAECETALRITQNPRKLNQSRAFGYGFVELQDVSSQIAAQMAGVSADDTVLDYCAGGGGKALALGMSLGAKGKIDAWDISQDRMKTIEPRARRAGLNVNILKKAPTKTYDVVFVDAPCSGSGAWRRAPFGKFKLTPERLEELAVLQSEILRFASAHVKAGGRLVYATCSLFSCENSEICDAFLSENQEFELMKSQQMTPLDAGDGFYAAVMRRGC